MPDLNPIPLASYQAQHSRSAYTMERSHMAAGSNFMNHLYARERLFEVAARHEELEAERYAEQWVLAV